MPYFNISPIIIKERGARGKSEFAQISYRYMLLLDRMAVCLKIRKWV